MGIGTDRWLLGKQEEVTAGKCPHPRADRNKWKPVGDDSPKETQCTRVTVHAEHLWPLACLRPP